jgi:phage shock protein C
MDKRLFRNEHDKVVAGVSSGIAEYMEVDVTIIRLLFVLSTIFLVGTGVLVYIVMWIVVPVNNDPAAKFSRFNDYYKGQKNNPFNSPNAFTQPQNAAEPTGSTSSTSTGWASPGINEDPLKASPKMNDFGKPFQKSNNETGRTVGGLFLLVIGLYFLMNEFNIIPFWFSLGKLWPLVFVAIGVSFIMKGKNKNAWETWKSQQEQGNAGTAPNGPSAPVDPVNPVNPEGVQPTVSPEPGTEAPAEDRFTKHDH